MKKTFLLFFVLCLALTTMAQEWTSITTDTPASFKKVLVSSSEDQIQVRLQVPGFYMTAVTTPRGEAYVISMPKAVSTAQAGEPNVPMTGIPVMIGDHARMDIRVVKAQYQDFENIEVAPSKGDFPRSVDPATVPYTYGECYNQDAFFPASNVGLYDPYIIRDFRGQNMVVYPFAYNPVTKTLRVYYDMTVEMYKVDDNGENAMTSRRSNTVKLDPDFKSVYQHHFINYEASMTKYSVLDEEGDLLIICYDNFYNYMTDFVNWKKTRGINTTIVKTSAVSSSLTYSNLKSYIQSQYNANNNITHVLLVGDVAQIPGYSYTGGGSSYSGLGDNAYGQIVGSDVYNDVFIGRFCANSASRVTTQANRAITYERDLTTSATWLNIGEGIARKEGQSPSAHNNEDDYVHMNNIRTDLLNYGYSTVYQRYANLSGYTATSSQISSDINSGVGIINYCNHGQETAWGANSSGYVYYAVSHVNALTNENKLPFIFSVACLVGKYDHSSDCFAEAWMNATNNNNPTGAIGTLMSYIEQPWDPPMWGQDECIDLLVESNSSNIKHTWGGVAINGIMAMFDHYSTSSQPAVGTYQSWILYGDPSLMLRTKTPTAMTVTHAGTIAPTATTYTVNVTNGNGAVATITDANHNILGKATVANNKATITISGTLTAGTELTLCVFGYNKVTDLKTISVVNPATAPTVTTVAISNIDKTTATGGGNVTADGGANVTARGICWSTSQNPTISGDHTTDGTGTGSFTSSMTSLTANTTYYVRAYATNSVGTAYGEEVSFTTLPAGIPGDVDLNENLSTNDAILILRHCMGGTQLSGQALLNADLDGNGTVSLNDAILLLRTLMNH
jgi:gingipain R